MIIVLRVSGQQQVQLYISRLQQVRSYAFRVSSRFCCACLGSRYSLGGQRGSGSWMLDSILGFVFCFLCLDFVQFINLKDIKKLVIVLIGVFIFILMVFLEIQIQFSCELCFFYFLYIKFSVIVLMWGNIFCLLFVIYVFKFVVIQFYFVLYQ